MTLPWSILPALNAKVSSGWSSIANSSSFMWLNVKKDSFTLKWTKKDETWIETLSHGGGSSTMKMERSAVRNRCSLGIWQFGSKSRWPSWESRQWKKKDITMANPSGVKIMRLLSDCPLIFNRWGHNIYQISFNGPYYAIKDGGPGESRWTVTAIGQVSRSSGQIPVDFGVQ